MTNERNVLVERRSRVGIATLNRPAKLNALNTPLVEELTAALKEFDADDDIGAVVVTGSGDRAFSAGGDMKEQREQLEAGTISRRRSASIAVRDSKKPIIAAIRGIAFGGGAILALNCDIRIAASDARIKLHGAGYGQVTAGAMLPRVVGEAKAKELLFTGDEIDAAEALRIGLVNKVVEPDELLDAAVDMATRIANNSARAIGALQEIIDIALPWKAAQDYEDEINYEIRRSPDSANRFKTAAARIVGPA